MEVNIYAILSLRGNLISTDNYWDLVEKLSQLEPNDWPKFQEQLKNLHSVKIYKTEAQTKFKELTTHKEKNTAEKSTAETQTTLAQSPEAVEYIDCTSAKG